jgi:signal transduction histidine kinase
MTSVRRFTSLRARITLAMLLVAMFSSAVFAFGVFIAAERLERTVLNRHIRAEFDTLAASARKDPELEAVQSALLLGFVGQQNKALPDEFAALPLGDYHDVHIGDKAYQVYVGDDGGRRLYVAYDITEWEALERPVIYVLIAGVVLSSFLAVWIGLRSSAQVIEPVTSLAARLKSLDPKRRKVRIAADYAGAEVLAIAEAFDRYMERLDGFVEREQLFTSAAAHELRTPLAVIQGGADILLDQPDLPPRARRATQRIKRAVHEMREYIEALLFLSRESQSADVNGASCELRSIVGDLTQDYRTLVDAQRVELDFDAKNDLLLDAPPALPMIVVSNLLRNAIENTEAGSVRVELDGRRLSVTDTGRGIDQEAQAALFERGYTTKSSGGMGLHLAKRICDRFGWVLTIASTPGRGTVAAVNFT